MQGFCLGCNEMRKVTTYEELEAPSGLLVINAKCNTCEESLVNIEIEEWRPYDGTGS